MEKDSEKGSAFGDSKDVNRSQNAVPPTGTYGSQRDNNTPPYPDGTYGSQNGYHTYSGGSANPGGGPTVTAANQYYNYNAQNIPPEVRRWNWGAFMYSWIWGCSNGAFLSLLSLIPFFGIIWVFVTGALGNKWAWQSGKFKDLDTFLAVQKTWNTAGIITFVITIAVIIFYIFAVVFFAAVFASYFGSDSLFDRYANYEYY